MIEKKLSVVIPVLNGAARLARAVGSLELHGTSGVDLVISDNASIDQTREIARDLAREYPSSILVQDSTMPVLEHFRTAVAECASPYVFLFAHDDEVSKGFLAEALGLLEQFDDVDGCLPNVVNVSPNGHSIPVQSAHDYLGLTHLSAQSMRRFMSRRLSAVNGIYGVWRRSVLLKSLDQVVAEDDLLNPLTDRSLVARLLLAKSIQPMGGATLMKFLPDTPSEVLSISQQDVGFDQVAAVLKAEIPPRNRAYGAYLRALRVKSRAESRASQIRRQMTG